MLCVSQLVRVRGRVVRFTVSEKGLLGFWLRCILHITLVSVDYVSNATILDKCKILHV